MRTAWPGCGGGVSGPLALARELQGALNSRIIIEQAEGLISHAGQIPMDDAFERLRTYSRHNQRQLSDVAHDLAVQRLRPEAILATTPKRGEMPPEPSA